MKSLFSIAPKLRSCRVKKELTLSLATVSPFPLKLHFGKILEMFLALPRAAISLASSPTVYSANVVYRGARRREGGRACSSGVCSGKSEERE